jgi:hypothetical protein
MQGFLDLYMMKSTLFSSDDLETLRLLFDSTINLAKNIYGDLIFRPYNPEAKEWQKSPQKAYYDAVMVSLSSHLNKKQTLIENRDAIINATKNMFEEHEVGTFTGRGNTKADIQNRIGLFDQMITAFA